MDPGDLGRTEGSTWGGFTGHDGSRGVAALLLYELCYSRQLGTPEAFTLSSLFLRFSISGLDFFFLFLFHS